MPTALSAPTVADWSPRSTKRSGIIRRSIARTTYENIDDWVRANNESFSLEYVRSVAQEFLDNWERQAFAVYRRHGLPTCYKCWRAGPDEPWQPIDQRPDGARMVGESYSLVYKIGEEVADADSEVGFATAILAKVHDARLHLNGSEDANLWRAFAYGATIAQNSEILHLEFGLAGWIGPGRLQAAGRREGGLARAKDARAFAQARQRVWCGENAKLNPALSQRSRAKLIARKLKGTPQEAAESTIRKAIAKMDHQHTT